jgi:hypothetical protein
VKRYMPGLQGALAGWHALPSLLAENEPSRHSPHMRSAVSEPAAVWPCPGEHICHGVHAWLPAIALNAPTHAAHFRLEDALGAAISNWPAVHSPIELQTRSAWAVGATLVNWPGGQEALCVVHWRSELGVGVTVSYSVVVHCVAGAHGLPSSEVDREVPDVHGVHWRSASAEPASDIPWPTGHVLHGVHVSSPTLAVKCPLAQSEHVRSLVAVAAAVV